MYVWMHLNSTFLAPPKSPVFAFHLSEPSLTLKFVMRNLHFYVATKTLQTIAFHNNASLNLLFSRRFGKRNDTGMWRGKEEERANKEKMDGWDVWSTVTGKKLAELRDVTTERKQCRRLAMMVARVPATDSTRWQGETNYKWFWIHSFIGSPRAFK